MSTEFYDSLEIRDPQQREEEQFTKLSEHLERTAKRASFVRKQLDGIEITSIRTREALNQIPVVRKSELIQLQAEEPLFGGLTAYDEDSLIRIFASPGPIYEPETKRPDNWRIARALYAAGFRRGMLVHNTFSYHFAPAGMMLESGILELGCKVFPAGVGQTEQQVQAIERLRPQAYSGTPSFLRIILDAADESDADVSSLEVGLVSGEPLPASLRDELTRYGVAVKQAYATADAGLIAYESEAMEGLIVDEGIILEIVQPGTNDQVKNGEVGEVVVTSFNPDYPLLRFGTGDMSAVMEGVSPCGRTNTRIKGWMGRADQTTKVRGLFVHPSQVAEIVKRYDQINRARLVVSNTNHQDDMRLVCEITDRSDKLLAEKIADSVRDLCKLRADVVLVTPGEIPKDGIIIEDARTYE